ncbi:hypothetical protein GCM10028805_20650 [Spirosoma harenae]
MKIKSLLLAFPVLCFACTSNTDVSDPALQMEASAYMGKKPAGVNTLTVDFNYDEPCTILGEEYVRQTFHLDEKVELAEAQEHGGCAFEWAGNKVVVSFAGAKPYASVQLAEYYFDRMYQGKPAAAVENVEEANEETPSGPEPEGTNAETSADSAHHSPTDNHPTHSGVTAVHPSVAEHPAVSTGHYEAVSGVGDKAVWDASAGALHVLYNNHIISVKVESKGKAEEKKHQAESLSEVLMDKIAENEYVRRL